MSQYLQRSATFGSLSFSPTLTESACSLKPECVLCLLLNLWLPPPEFPSLSRIHRFLCQGIDCLEMNPGTSRFLLGKTKMMAMWWQTLFTHLVVPPESDRMLHRRLLATDGPGDGLSLWGILFSPSILFSCSVLLCATKGCCFYRCDQTS